ncbi:hypothetical protein PybrP1_000832 [[Pythium] brassicae (nom. inval.)]|nr:hypothetical protein PybrP1_000832 [[Pythium] brassicae (nom. inval.)]
MAGADNADAHAHNGGEEQPMELELSRFMFTVAWWGMFLTHASIAAFLFATNQLYAYMGSFSLMYYNKLLASDLRAELANLGWIFSLAGAVHCVEMAKMLLFSAHARELSFRFQPRRTKVTPALPPSVVAVRSASTGNDRLKRLLHVAAFSAVTLALTVGRTAARLVPRRVRAAAKRVLRALLRVRRALFDRRHGFMSVQSKYFNYLFLIRETVEIASQSYQMHNSAELLARPWLNAFFLALVVVNCWSTPLLQHALAHSTGLERAMCLVFDGLLDAGSAIFIPLVVFLPYAQTFDTAVFAFPPDRLYDPQWFVNMVRENRMLFAMSKSDLFSKLVPHHSLYSCTKNVKKFIVRRPSDAARSVRGRHDSSGRAAEPDSKQAKEKVEYPGKGKRLVHVVFTLWGIAALAIYLHARHVSVSADVTACKLKLRPWFATTYACASYTFDCHEQGQVDSIAASDLAGLHSDYLAALVIANCPALVMPAELQRFPNLLKFLLYNSSIASWDAGASLNSHNHSALISVCLVRANMTAFPLGLQASLPSTMQDFQVSTSNLTALPATLGKVWSPITIYYFEYCDFAEFPLVLLELRCDDMSLAGSKIATLPSDMTGLAFPWVDFVLSNSSRLSDLPAMGIRANSLSIENTGVSELPAWVTAGTYGGMAGLSVYAYNTPYCIRKLADASGSGAGSSGGGTGVVTINCETRDPNGDARYPLALTTAMFQPV